MYYHLKKLNQIKLTSSIRAVKILQIFLQEFRNKFQKEIKREGLAPHLLLSLQPYDNNNNNNIYS